MNPANWSHIRTTASVWLFLGTRICTAIKPYNFDAHFVDYFRTRDRKQFDFTVRCRSLCIWSMGKCFFFFFVLASAWALFRFFLSIQFKLYNQNEKKKNKSLGDYRFWKTALRCLSTNVMFMVRVYGCCVCVCLYGADRCSSFRFHFGAKRQTYTLLRLYFVNAAAYIKKNKTTDEFYTILFLVCPWSNRRTHTHTPSEQEILAN